MSINTLSRDVNTLKSPLYTTLPRSLLTRLPTDLTTFDLAVLCGVMVLARRDALQQQRHERAHKAGGKAITRARDEDDRLQQQWRDTKALRRQGIKAKAPILRHDEYGEPIYRFGKAADSRIRHAGRAAYRRSIGQQQRGEPPEYIEFETTRHAILQAARLSCGSNVGAVEASLDRLTHPIGDAKPPLHLYHRLGPQLHLRVHGCWLLPPFVRVPLPLPTRSRIATMLYLLLFQLDLHSPERKRRGMARDNLCARLGIAGTRCRPRDRAVAVVNQHLATLDVNALKTHDIEVSPSIDIHPDRHQRGSVVIVAGHAPIRLKPKKRQPKSKVNTKPLVRVPSKRAAKTIEENEKLRQLYRQPARPQAATDDEREWQPHEIK